MLHRAAPTDVTERLQRLRTVILAEIPNGEEKLRYGIPAVMLGGSYPLHYAARQHHIGIYDSAGAIRRGIDDGAARTAGITNDISPAGLAATLRAVGNQAGASGRQLRDLLSANQWNDEVPARLPAGTRVELP